MSLVLTGGKFNKIHPGHVWLLKQARKKGKKLVVVLANDLHNKRSYALPAKQRKKNLEKLNIADKVVVGDAADYSKVIKKYKPSVIVLGYDQKLPAGIREKFSGKVKVIKFSKRGSYKSRNLAAKR